MGGTNIYIYTNIYTYTHIYKHTHTYTTFCGTGNICFLAKNDIEDGLNHGVLPHILFVVVLFQIERVFGSIYHDPLFVVFRDFIREVPSCLGIGKGYTGGYHEYFGPDADIDSHIYLMLSNDLIHSIAAWHDFFVADEVLLLFF